MTEVQLSSQSPIYRVDKGGSACFHGLGGHPECVLAGQTVLYQPTADLAILLHLLHKETQLHPLGLVSL